MSREIKLKAVLGNVVSVNSFDINRLADYSEHEWEFSDGSTLPANDVELGDLEYIQFTGLKDKNGKEIYEGDILQADAEDPYLKVKYVDDPVCASTACFGLFDSWGYYDSMEDCHLHLQNVGNIFEKPELFE